MSSQLEIASLSYLILLKTKYKIIRASMTKKKKSYRNGRVSNLYEMPDGDRDFHL